MVTIINKKPLMVHLGEDYALININGEDYELNLGLMKDLYLSGNLELDKDIIKEKFELLLSEI